MIDQTILGDVGFLKYFSTVARRQLMKRVFHSGIVVRLPNGVSMNVSPKIQFTFEIIATDGDMDWGSEKILRRFLRKDRDFFDVGANIGYYCCYMTDLVNKVHAFEIDEYFIPILKANTQQCSNVEVVEFAVMDKPGSVEFLKPQRITSSGQIQGAGNHLAGQKTRAVTVAAVSIDSYCSERQDVWPCAIKMDTDGSEKQILHGAVATIERTQPVILTEWTHVDDIAAHEAELWKFTTDLQYKIWGCPR